MAHANRSKSTRRAVDNPPASEVRAARERAGHTPEQAAKVIYTSTTRWTEWEKDVHQDDQAAWKNRQRMHPAFFELYLLKTGQKTLDQLLDDEAARSAREHESR